jgi:5-methylthioadenosine/S-adenosylhomocysteine deaminase
VSRSAVETHPFQEIRLILRGATILTLDLDSRVAREDLRITPQGRIDALLPPGRAGHAGEEEIDLAGRIIMPGLVQSHIHLCQTLMRGLAERRTLAEWLRERIWPLEAVHDAATLRASARLGLLELATAGTTAILDMGTTRNIQAILDASAESGLRVCTGTALMDEGAGTPPTLLRNTLESLDETRRLIPAYRDGRVSLCLAPRFIPSVSEEGWRAVASLAREENLLIHTHACETSEENAFVQEKTGNTPFAYLEGVGAAGARLRAAHGVWICDEDRAVIRRTGSAVVHCPGSNAKLGSGTADVLRLWEDRIPVGIGCDGAACNNRLDPWEEMRRAAAAISLLHGPRSVEPERILAMATRVGAELLDLGAKVGSIVAGKEADLVVLDPAIGGGLWSAGADVHGQVLYGAGREHVEQVWVQGEMIVKRGVHRNLSRARVLREASRAASRLEERAEAIWQSPSN